MTAPHHDQTTDDLDQLAATYRFLALITELRARAHAARDDGELRHAERLEAEASFLLGQLPATPPVCTACGRLVPPRARRVCVCVGVAEPVQAVQAPRRA